MLMKLDLVVDRLDGSADGHVLDEEPSVGQRNGLVNVWKFTELFQLHDFLRGGVDGDADFLEAVRDQAGVVEAESSETLGGMNVGDGVEVGLLEQRHVHRLEFLALELNHRGGVPVGGGGVVGDGGVGFAHAHAARAGPPRQELPRRAALVRAQRRRGGEHHHEKDPQRPNPDRQAVPEKPASVAPA
jgi:hypothetical protein